MTRHEKELDAARRIVESAGRLTLEYFRAPLDVEHKSDQSPVTIADRRAEELIRAELSRAFPRDGLLGEELGDQPGTSGRRWIIDPIDGTQSFIRGVPLYGVLLGLEEEGRCVVGVAGFPALGQIFWAASGQGAFCDGRAIRVAAPRPLSAATLLTSDAAPRHFGEKYASFDRLLRSVGRHRGWGDCYGYALLAMGHAEIMVDPQLNPWDSAAIVPIVEEAGGAFFAWNGEPSIYAGSGVATTLALRDEVLALLRG